jgi:hypothetical protein
MYEDAAHSMATCIYTPSLLTQTAAYIYIYIYIYIYLFYFCMALGWGPSHPPLICSRRGAHPLRLQLTSEAPMPATGLYGAVSTTHYTHYTNDCAISSKPFHWHALEPALMLHISRYTNSNQMLAGRTILFDPLGRPLLPKKQINITLHAPRCGKRSKSKWCDLSWGACAIPS